MSREFAIAMGVSILGIITFLYRYSFISENGKKIAQKIPPQFLMLLGPTTFTVIVINGLLLSKGQEDFNFKVLVLTAAAFIAYFTKSFITTLVFGLLFLYILQNYSF